MTAINRYRLVLALLTALVLTSACSTARPWVENAVLLGHPTAASQHRSAPIEAIYSDYAVYIDFDPPSPVVGTGDALDARYAEDVDEYEPQYFGRHAMLLQPGTYRFSEGGYDLYVVKSLPTVDQEHDYSDEIESLIAEVGKGGGRPDVFLSITPQTTLIATKGYFDFDQEFEAGKFYASGPSDESGVSRIIELDGAAFFSEQTGEPVASYLLDCETFEGDSCIPVKAAFEHRASMCQEYECLTEARLMERIEAAKIVLGARDRSNLIVSSGGVAFRYNPPLIRAYRLYVQRCYLHQSC